MLFMFNVLCCFHKNFVLLYIHNPINMETCFINYYLFSFCNISFERLMNHVIWYSWNRDAKWISIPKSDDVWLQKTPSEPFSYFEGSVCEWRRKVFHDKCRNSECSNPPDVVFQFGNVHWTGNYKFTAFKCSKQRSMLPWLMVIMLSEMLTEFSKPKEVLLSS